MSKREIKSMTLILMILVVFVSLSCVSAQDTSGIASDAADDISDTDAPVLQMSTEDDVLEAADNGTFADLANEIQSNSFFEMKKNYVFNLTTDADYVNGILIDHSFTLVGGGYTINANGAARIFNITSTGVSISDIKLINGNASEGAALNVASGAEFSAMNVIFENNIAEDNGGAIYTDGGEISLTDCVLDSNDVTKLQSSASENRGGAAIYAKDAQLTLVNTNVTNNGRSDLDRRNGDMICGVVHLIDSNAIITGGLFENNTGIYGGAIDIGGDGTHTLTVTDTTFNNNKAYNGGAINGGNIITTISNCNFTNNWVVGPGSSGYHADGGAIAVDGKGSLTVTDSKFNSNRATGGGANGGAIYVSKGNGNSVEISMDNCTFEKNQADNMGGALMLWTDYNVPISTCKFIDNSVEGSADEGYGGAIYFQGKTLELTDSLFKDNNASNVGGAIYIYDTLADIDNVTFDSNNAVSGGAIYADNNVRAKDSRFIKNNATEGGAIYFTKWCDDSSLTNSNFTDNSASNNGGAVYTDSSKISITDCVLDSNDVANLESSAFDNKGGAAIYAKDAQLTLVNTNVTNNGRSDLDRSKGDMINAVINLINSSADITGGLFENNTGIYGGAIYADGDGSQTLTVSGATFNNNKGYNGGAIDISNMVTTISDCEFNDNWVIGPGSKNYYALGGAVAADGNGSFTLTGSNFTGNHADGVNGSAGAVSVGLDEDCIALIDDCEFKDNTAVFKAGAVFIAGYDGDATISDSKFFGNDAEMGDAIYNGGFLALAGNTIEGNGADIYTNNPITTQAWVIVNDNTTIDVEYYDTIPIVVKITDDMGNFIRINEPTLEIDLGDRWTRVALTLDEATGFYTTDAYLVDQKSGLLTPSRTTLGKYISGYTAAKNLNSTYINMIKANPILNVTYENVTYPGDVVITVNLTGKAGAPKISWAATAATPFMVTVNDVVYKVKITNGIGTVTVPDLPAGDYVINAYWAGNTKYNGVGPQDYDLTVSKANATLIVNTGQNNVFAYGDNVTIFIGLYDDDTGEGVSTNITVVINNVARTVEVINGEASFNVTGFEPGRYAVMGEFNNENYNGPVYDSSVFEVLYPNRILSIEVDDINYGENAIVNITITDYKGNKDKGTVILNISGQEIVVIVDGTKSVEIPGLAVGEYSINATLSAEGLDAEVVNDTESFNVGKADVTIDVAASDVIYGEDVIVEVTGSVDGDYTVTVNSVTKDVALVAGEAASVNFGVLDADTYAITAAYAETANYNAAVNNTETVTVCKAASSVEIISVVNATYPDDVVVTIEVVNATDISVVISQNGAPAEATVVVSEDNTIVTISGLPVGEYTINITNVGDVNYNASSAVALFNVSQATPVISVTAEDVTYNADVVVTVLSDASGDVTVSVGDKDVSDTVEAGVAKEFIISGLAANEDGYAIIVKLAETQNYTAGVNDTESVKVMKAASSVEIEDIADVTYNASVKVSYKLVNGTVENIEVYDAYGEQITASIDNSTAGIVIISGLSAGEYTIEIYNAENENYTGSFAVATFNVLKDGVIIDIDVDGDLFVDSEVNITFTVPTDIDGRLDVIIDGEMEPSFILINGTCTITGTYDAGNHTVIVSLMDDTNYENSVASITFDIEKLDPETSITAPNIVAGNDATITVTVPGDAIGAVLFEVDGNKYYAYIENGAAILTLSELAIGNHTVYYNYVGDDKYLPDSGEAKFEVFANDTYKIIAESGAIQVGDNATVNVLLPEDAQGLVFVTVGNDTYSAYVFNGQADVIVPGLPEGSYTAEVYYSGDDKYAPSNTTAGITVDKVANVPMNITALDVEADETPVIIVELPEDATGDVTVTVGNDTYTVPVEDGLAVIILDELPVGNYTAEVAYSGDDKYESVSDTANFTVDKVSDTFINAYAEPVEVGEDTIIQVLLPEDATGKVRIEINGIEYYEVIVDGVARFEIENLTAGEYEAEVAYSGDGKYDPASITVPVVVEKVPDAEINATSEPGEYGSPAIIKVTLPEDATGIVVADIDGELYAANVENGVATIAVPGLEEGNYTAEVTYYGDDKYDPVSAEVDIEVTNGLRITAPDVIKYYHGPERFVVYTTDYAGNPIDNITVKITINGRTYERTSENGQASLGLNLNSGNYSVTVEFAGNEQYEAQNVTADVEILPTIFANDVVKVFRNDTQYYAQFVDSEGNPLVNTEVTFNINGVMYKKTTNESGWAKLNINLPAGEYILTAINPVTGEMISSNITVLSQFAEHGDLVKVYGTSDPYVVQIRTKDGNIAGAGETVTFNINGVIYNKVTNETGHAVLNINLPPGEYIITGYYNDERVSDKITVVSA